MDTLDVMANGKDTFPSSNGIGTDYRVNGLEDITDILRGSSRSGEEGKSIVIRSFLKAGLGIVCSQSV